MFERRPGGRASRGDPRRRPLHDQPWRALKRGFVLLMTKTRPLRRMMRQSLCRFLADFNELTTFMAGLGRLLGAAEGGTYGSTPGLSMPRPEGADFWIPPAKQGAVMLICW